MEVSTDEVLLLNRKIETIIHPYSDALSGNKKCVCYGINEIVAEKLRALKQRFYTAPRDFYDLYHLTEKFTKDDWEHVIPVFLEKMEHKHLAYNSPKDFIDDVKLTNVKQAWENSIAHQIAKEYQAKGKEIIAIVAKKINTYLPDGK